MAYKLSREEIEEYVGQSFPDAQHMIDFISGHLFYLRTHSGRMSKEQYQMVCDMQLVLELIEREVAHVEPAEN